MLWGIPGALIGALLALRLGGWLLLVLGLVALALGVVLLRRGRAVYALPLPEDKYYRVELIDVWNMIRTVLNENAFGTTKLRLPGKEGLAVLATRID